MDSDDDMEETPSWKGVPATIICINAYDRDETFEVAYAATCRMIRQCLRLSGSNFIGVCFYGTEVTNSSILGINSVEEIFPLKLPTLEDYRKLQNFDISSLNMPQDLILSEVLWYCSRSFASCKRQLSSRNIIILSRFEEPPLQSDQKPALKRVVEIADSNIDIKLINITKTQYEIDSFYNNLLIEANKKEEVALPKPVWDKKEIEQLLYQQSHRHLAVARLNFEIGNGVAIGVGVYGLLKSNGQPMKKSDLHRDTNAVLTSITKTTKVTIKDDTQMDIDNEEQEAKPVPLLKSEQLYYRIYGGEKVQFTQDEMKTLRNPFGPPLLKLLGFKPATFICKEKWFLKPCYFLFPNEGIIEGSFVAFNALYTACIKTNVVAICVLCTRVNARPAIVALSPSTKPLGLDVEVGFDVIRIPFVENVRQLTAVDDCDEVQMSEENKSVMKDILKDLTFKYKPDMFENPKVQKQYRAIEAIALDEDDDDDPFIDTTKPDSKRFQNLKDDLFQEIFGPFGAVAVKKGVSSREGGPASKKPKQGIDENLLQERISNQKVKDYTVVQLKDILYSRNLSDLPALTGLKKNELVELVYKYCK